MIRRLSCFAAVLLALTPGVPTARAADASGPRGTTLNIYDTGFALVSELRSVTLSGRDDEVVIRQLPSRLDPASVSFAPVAGSRGLDVLEQRFEYDLAGSDRLFRRYLNRPVRLPDLPGAPEGKLLGAPLWEDDPGPRLPLLLGMGDGSVRAFHRPEDAGEIAFPDAARVAYLEPTLVWQARGAQEGPQSLRLTYLTGGFAWEASYDVLLREDGAAADLSARVVLRNQSGGRFDDARVRLVLTEKGHVAPRPAAAEGEWADTQRYVYGLPEPVTERAAASLLPVETYEVPRAMTMAPGDEAHVQIARAQQMSVARFYVYDGVRFDRFQRNRRNDWNYGTESHATVDTHLEFTNATSSGLGFNLPPGRVHLYQARADGGRDLLGSEFLPAVPAGQGGQVRLGPARGLRGERERTGYAEVKPLHEFEESFEIRLSNDSDQDVQVRVVEHLYRWHDYEIVKADAEYTTLSPQTIEFRADLKPGGKRALHYTVRYRW